MEKELGMTELKIKRIIVTTSLPKKQLLSVELFP